MKASGNFTTNPESGTVSYTYNGDGTLARKTDAKNNIEYYCYDAYQRLTSIPGQLMQATFGGPPGQNLNQLRPEHDYAYTPAGKVSSKTLEVQSAWNYNMYGQLAYGALTASYTYDNQGWRLRRAQAGGRPTRMTGTGT
jgi:YD repeat-containing protein